MNVNYNITSDEAKKIINFYRKLYDFLFKLGIYIFIFIVSLLIIFWFNKSGNYIIKADFNNKVGFEKSSNYFVSNKIYSDDSLSFSGIDIKILGGYIFGSGMNIYSDDNLLNLSGIVLPYSVVLKQNDMDFIKNIDFQNPASIQTLLDTIVFSDSNSSFNKRISSTTDDLNNGDLIDTFFLSCTNYPILTTNFCSQNINLFFNTVPYYDLKSDIKGLSLLYQNMAKSGLTDQFCRAIIDNVFYQKSFSNGMEELIDQCPSQYITTYERVKIFNDINDNISKGFIDSNLSIYDDINDYKLLSFQKLIYENLTKKNVNIALLESYIEYVSQLMKTNKLSDDYVNLLYVYNNKYLKDRLNSFHFETNFQLNQRIQKVLEKLADLNQGNYYLGYSGLNSTVNQDILSYVNSNQQTSSFISTVNFDQVFQSFIKKYSYLIVYKSDYDKENSIYDVNGIINISLSDGSREKKQPLKVDIKFNFDKGNLKFTLANINLPEQQELSSIINQSIISNGNITLDEVYRIIGENMNLSTFGIFDICTSFEELFRGGATSDYNFISCNNTSIQVSKGIIQYTFIIDNKTLKGVNISNPTLQQLVNKKIQGKTILLENVPKLIMSVLKIDAPQDSNTQQGASDITLIAQKFIEFLGVKPSNIVEKQGKYIVYFRIDKNSFEGVFDIKDNYKISQISLLFIEGDKITRLSLQGYTTNFVSDSITEFNKWKTNPMEFVKEKSQKAYDDYQVLVEK